MSRERALLVLWLVVSSSAAAADELVPTLGQQLSEISHTVDISVADGVATYHVRRVFSNEGSVADEASLDIDLPFGAAVTGLRIRARDTWYDGDLLPADEAARAYQELTGRGAFPVKDPALLQWVWADKVHLQVFPVLPGKTSTVEYKLTVPTRYDHGRYLLSYPRFNGGPLATPVVTVEPLAGVAEQRVEIDGVHVEAGVPVTLTPAKVEAWDGVVPKDPTAGWALSHLVIKDPHGARGDKVAVDVDITHTYKGDLLVQLVTPAGKVLTLHDRTGGNGNDVRGHYDLAVPPGTPAAGTWRLVVSDHAARDVGTINAWRVSVGGVSAAASDLPIFIPDSPEGADDLGLVTIGVVAPAPADTLDARLGKVVASSFHAFLRLELDLAKELRPLPRDASVVFVVDGSRSMGRDGIDAQLKIAKAYLSHIPDATFEVIVYRRYADALGFQPATRFDAAMAEARAAGKLEPGNGSALDNGLSAAAGALHGRSGPCRIVVLTDDLPRSRFTNAAALTALAGVPDDTVLHVVLPDLGDTDDEAAEEQLDDHALAPIAAGHKGILVRVTGVRGKGLEQAVLHLVRPTRIDHFHIAGAEVDRAALIPDTLLEGTGVRAMLALDTAPDSLVLEGKIWGEPYRRVVAVSAPFSVATAGFVFSEHQYVDLSDAEQLTVAMEGRAVSPVTSYLAVEPGVRPSPIGLQRDLIGAGRYGAVGHGSGGGSAYGALGARTPPDLRRLAAAGVDGCLARNPVAAGWHLVVDVETTKDEIVDVVPDHAESAADSCIVEAVWAVTLDQSFDLEREHFALDYSR